MSKIVLSRFVLPPGLRVATGTTITYKRNTDTLGAFLKSSLTSALSSTLPDTAVRALIARHLEIRIECWKPASASMGELRETIGEVMADRDPESSLHG